VAEEYFVIFVISQWNVTGWDVWWL